MKRQYIIDVAMKVVVDAEGEIEEVAENFYAQCAELARSDDHLLYLEVSPCPLPQISDIEPDTLHFGNDSFEQEGGEASLP